MNVGLKFDGHGHTKIEPPCPKRDAKWNNGCEG